MGRYGRLVKRLVGSVDYWAQIAMRRFVADLSRCMKAQNISRAMLAEKLETSPAYITKVMRGDVNFTLETMTKLALAVGGKLQIQIVDGPQTELANIIPLDQSQNYRKADVWRSDLREQATAAAKTTTFALDLTIYAANNASYICEKTEGQAA